jgi:trk system potassium uptake protein TrkA
MNPWPAAHTFLPTAEGPRKLKVFSSILHSRQIGEPGVFIAATDGDNTNLTISQIAGKHYQVPRVICRVMDPARAEWYAEQGLHTICPTSYAIEMFERALEEV